MNYFYKLFCCLVAFCFLTGYVYAQTDVPNERLIINGETLEPFKNGDTIYFSNGDIDRKYFEQKLISAEINQRKFQLATKLSYPHRFMVNLKSEQDDIVLRSGSYFIDETSNRIQVDSLGECSCVTGKTNKEFKNVFIPFVFKGEKYDCEKWDFSNMLYSKNSIFEERLLQYIQKHPESYVGLWFLIQQLENEGYSKNLDKGIRSFTTNIRNGKLWQLAHQTLKDIEIRKNSRFPSLSLRDTLLKIQKMRLPTADYTLVDYWFSRCRPCLEAFPKLKELYAKYHDKGFEIISISVDKTLDIPKWQQRIKEKGLIWPQYLDENGNDAAKNKVIIYPTTFLLDVHGVIIEKNIQFDRLEELLENSL